jgi:hypothetical protein
MEYSRATIAALFCALCVSGLAAAGETDEAATATQQEPCCFENPRYSGTCQVTPGPEETCGDILAYLNNPNSVGKSYCGNTKVRGGWSSVACGSSTSTTVAESCNDSRK